MGIKTKFNPMGGGAGAKKGDISEWYYTAHEGYTPGLELRVYAGFKNEVYVPTKNTIIHDYWDNDSDTIYTSSVQATTYSIVNRSDVDGTPDHVKVSISVPTYTVNITNSSGTQTYNSTSDLILPTDWTQVETISATNAIHRLTFVVYPNTTPFRNIQSITDVDLQGVPWTNYSMYLGFYNCTNLVSVQGINNTVTDMSTTFRYCYNLNYNIQIPNSVTNMTNTFHNCTSLNQNIQIPNSVTNMANTFQNCISLNQSIQIPASVTNMTNTFRQCESLNQNIQIPNSVINMTHTFHNCTSLNQNIQIPASARQILGLFNRCTSLDQNIQIPNTTDGILHETFKNCTSLNQNIQIPNSITNMNSTFMSCTNLNQNIQIPNSVTDLDSTFHQCTSLNQNIQIPESVTRMTTTFQRCDSLSGRINIFSTNITIASSCFGGTSLAKEIWLPYRYINNTASATRNAFNDAGYVVGTGQGNSTTAGCVMYDWVAGQGYPTYVGNGTYWRLAKWTNSSAPTSVVVPNQILNYPVAVTNACFTANKVITSLDLNNVMVTGGAGTFENCQLLTTIKNLSQGESANYQGFFFNCQNLQSVSMNDSTLTRTAHPYMPNTVTSGRAMYAHCKNIVNFYIDSFSVTTLYRTWNGCNTRDINVYISSPNVSNIAGVFYGYVNSRYKNIHIYFKYKNGVATKTFNAFNGSAFYRNNSTTHCYMYNLGECPV